jgi:hypothetical protein
VRRASVTDSFHLLEGDGILKCTRGLVVIRDRLRLEQAAAYSYGAPKCTNRRSSDEFPRHGVVVSVSARGQSEAEPDHRAVASPALRSPHCSRSPHDPAQDLATSDVIGAAVGPIGRPIDREHHCLQLLAIVDGSNDLSALRQRKPRMLVAPASSVIWSARTSGESAGKRLSRSARSARSSFQPITAI